MEKKLLSVTETAKRLRISRQGVFYLIKKGHIKPANNIVGKAKFFTEEDIYEYISNRNKLH
jgi:predicted site-specific integrase-resolvase